MPLNRRSPKGSTAFETQHQLVDRPVAQTTCSGLQTTAFTPARDADSQVHQPLLDHAKIDLPLPVCIRFGNGLEKIPPVIHLRRLRETVE
jgi:hypothetical protein